MEGNQNGIILCIINTTFEAVDESVVCVGIGVGVSVSVGVVCVCVCVRIVAVGQAAIAVKCRCDQQIMALSSRETPRFAQNCPTNWV